ncbi:MAG TPA: NADP-dependent oxidoreductase [Sphingomonas sp.]|jgi:hypothetical protein|uniref:NADP-dependent oxidoreductase n=1 Tax=Sphingomonas sp. TaxID=28214 RepID=UPI002EDACCB0
MTAVSRIVLARRPVGMPVADDFREEAAELPPIADGEVLVAVRTLSIDPAIRGFLDDRPSYLPPVAIGETVRGMMLGEVLASRNPALVIGQHVRALAGWADRVVLSADALGLEVVETDPDIAIETRMGALGPAGLTAWVGLHVIAAVRPGETVLVSAAAGAVGSVACQIARLRGCRVIGLAGSAAKCAAIRDLGVETAIDYRAESDLAAAIAAAAPGGVDVYFDNVGGATLETILPLMRDQGRVAVCGMIGDYNDQDHPYGVRTLWQLVVRRLTLRGFLTYDHGDRLAEAQRDLDAWASAGALRSLETIYHGIGAAPQAFIDLMARRTIGKTLVRL